MENSKDFDFSEILYIPLPQIFKPGRYVSLINELSRENEEGKRVKLSIFAFNCLTAKEIPETIDKEIKDVQEFLTYEIPTDDRDQLKKALELIESLKKNFNKDWLVALIPDEVMHYLLAKEIILSKSHPMVFVSGIAT